MQCGSGAGPPDGSWTRLAPRGKEAGTSMLSAVLSLGSGSSEEEDLDAWSSWLWRG